MKEAILILGAVILLVPNSAIADTQKDLGMTKPWRLTAVKPDKTRAPVFELITLSLDLEATYGNPFDSSQIDVEAIVTPPDREPWRVPGFLYRPYARSLDGKEEKVEPAGPPEWQVRLSLPKPGKYNVTVNAKNGGSEVTSKPIALEAMPADAPGFIRCHATDHRYFVTDRGETFYLVGANVCWGGPGGTFSLEDWFGKYAANGCNFSRVWLSPAFVTCAMNTIETGSSRINLGNAWRLDQVLETAGRSGMRLMLCIDSYNILNARKMMYGAWDSNPYTRANGGPLAEPIDYFTNEAMLKAYRDRLRYLVARYGWNPAVFAWEFWNEVDLVDGYNSDVVTNWHRDMARFLRALDPWKHLITTSFSRPKGDPNVDALPELDFVQTHHYRGKDIVKSLGEDREAKAAAQLKPHFVGEFGITQTNRSAEMDPTGINIHDGAYASVGQQQAGTPMTWWWDNYTEPKNLYPIFGAFSRWIKGFDFVAQNAQPLTARILYKGTAPDPAPLRILGLAGKTMALVWVQNTAYTWFEIAQNKKEPEPVPPTTLRLEGLPKHQWRIEEWDTNKGEVTKTSSIDVGDDGVVELALPAIVHDAAFRLVMID